LKKQTNNLFIETPHLKRVRGKSVPRFFIQEELSAKRFWLEIASDARRAFVSVVRKIWCWTHPHAKNGWQWGGRKAGKIYKRYRNREPKFFEVSLSFGKAVVKLKLSWIAILFLSFVAYNFWPSKHIIAEPAPVKTEIVEVKPIETKLEPIEPVAPKVVLKLAISSGWHRDCRPQTEAVHQAVINAGLGDQWTYINYIFSRESCNDPGRLNAGGCRGLGQACPGSKLPCGPEDIACQVSWFNGYAQGKGGWYASYQIWISKNWW